MSVEPVSELRHGDAEVDYTPVLTSPTSTIAMTSTSPFAAWWRIRFAPRWQLGRGASGSIAPHRAQAVLCLRRLALVKPSLMRRVRIIRNCL